MLGEKQEAPQKQYEHVRPPMKICGVLTKKEKEQVKVQKEERFVSGTGCRRIYLDQEMDGRVWRG